MPDFFALVAMARISVCAQIAAPLRPTSKMASFVEMWLDDSVLEEKDVSGMSWKNSSKMALFTWELLAQASEAL